MKKTNEIIVFKSKKIRRHWDDKKKLWYFSVIDVVRVLTDSKDAIKYWNKLAERLRKEGNKSVTKCHQLKFLKNASQKILMKIKYVSQV